MNLHSHHPTASNYHLLTKTLLPSVNLVKSDGQPTKCTSHAVLFIFFSLFCPHNKGLYHFSIWPCGMLFSWAFDNFGRKVRFVVILLLRWTRTPYLCIHECTTPLALEVGAISEVSLTRSTRPNHNQTKKFYISSADNSYEVYRGAHQNCPSSKRVMGTPIGIFHWQKRQKLVLLLVTLIDIQARQPQLPP